MKKNVVTHNKTMHADEITAIALLKIFTEDEIVIHRVDHDTKDFTNYDFVIDIGRKYDGVKFFDHHQFKGGKSSAGMIWEYLGLEKKYPRISRLIDMVDKNDVGILKSKEFEYSSLLKAFNTNDLSSLDQDKSFEKAVEFSMTVLNSMKKSQEELLIAKHIVANSFIFNRNPKVIELEQFTSHWTTYINGEITPHIKAVVWEDEIENNWKVKIPSKCLGSFDLVHKRFNDDPNMDFVHSAGHFAIASTEEQMIKFINKNIK